MTGSVIPRAAGWHEFLSRMSPLPVQSAHFLLPVVADIRSSMIILYMC